MKKQTTTEAEKIKNDKGIDPTQIKTMVAHLKLRLKDVWGGDGHTRVQKFEIPRIARVTKSKRTKSTMPGYDSEREVTEVKTDIIDKEVKTFNEKDGKPIYYIGRKIRGTMRQTGTNLARMESFGFPSISFVVDMLTMVTVTPDIILIGDKEWRDSPNYYLGNSGQRMARSSSFVPLYFDALKEVVTEIDIKYPSVFDKQVRVILNLLPTMRTGNRRMMKIEILECKFIGE